MAQTQFPFDSSADAIAAGSGAVASAAPPFDAPAAATTAADSGLDAIGFAIGWDHARHRLTPPVEHLHAGNPVRQGWSAGRSVFGGRTLALSAAVRQWLQLRLRAWQHGQAFESVQVTPRLLTRLASAACPVTRERLAPDLGRSGDIGSGQIERLSQHAAYAAGNLASFSTRALQARGSRDWQDALALAGRIASGAPGAAGGAGRVETIDGLDAAMWTRLAVLASFCTPLPHAAAARLPLRVLPPNRVRVINPVQALQVMLTLQFTQAGYARRLLGLAALMPCSETRQAFQIFMHTLLARRLAAGPAPQGLALRHALEDSWADVLVNRRWQRLASRLDAAGCERVLQAAARRGLAGDGCHWITPDQACDGWALASEGREASAGPDSVAAAAAPRAQATDRAGSALADALPISGSRRPGSERKRGSQKLAS